MNNCGFAALERPMRSFYFTILLYITTLCCLFSPCWVLASQHPVIKQVQELISKGEERSLLTFKATGEAIRNDPDVLLPLLVEKAKVFEQSDQSLATYIWAISMTGSPDAVEHIIKITHGRTHTTILNSTYQAMTRLGGEKAATYLFHQLEETLIPMLRFTIFNSLAQLHYKPGIAEAVEILDKEPKEYYWQPIFVFCNYGDDSITALLDMLNSKSPFVRKNTIMVLGHWLMTPHALSPLQEQFWKERDPKIRIQILSAIEWIGTFDEIIAFSKEVAKKDPVFMVSHYAKETIKESNNIIEQVENFRKKKKEDQKLFKNEIKKLKDSLGKKGSYDILSAYSTKENEEELKKLKQAILRRNSDKCLKDYQKINNIIRLNRLL
jgi:hypothetical protein